MNRNWVFSTNHFLKVLELHPPAGPGPGLSELITRSIELAINLYLFSPAE